jgi:hypothetical protein
MATTRRQAPNTRAEKLAIVTQVLQLYRAGELSGDNESYAGQSRHFGREFLHLAESGNSAGASTGSATEVTGATCGAGSVPRKHPAGGARTRIYS